MNTSLLVELIKVAIGQDNHLEKNPSINEWESALLEAEKQAVTGLAFDGIQKLPADQYPPQNILFQWIGLYEQIKAQNRLVNKRTAELHQMFGNDGFRSCVLKGQGNAQMYPNPSSRTPGDIDLWVDGCREDIRDYVKVRWPKAQDGNKHLGVDIFSDVPVEVHYLPSTHIVPQYNKRFQNYIQEQADNQFSNLIKIADSSDVFSIPTVSFNVIYQMSHIMSHFFVEGIGLRHFIDYYFVLRNVKTAGLDPKSYEEIFSYLGMKKFAQGVMWVELECLCLEPEYLLVEPNERIGKVILKEMQEGGNFGHYDERYKGRNNGLLMRGIIDTYRLVKLSAVFPSEAMWKIVDKINNQKWKLKGA